MSVAWISLAALAIAILVSCFSPINVGFLSIALAFLIGSLFAKMNLSTILSGFPAGLFLTLTGITLLFAQANTNGTLEKLARHSIRLARGNRGVIPILFFFLAVMLATIGAGNIASTALLAPIAMSIAGELQISGFLMAIMLANGANAGAFSPIAPTGVIAWRLMERVGLQGMAWPNFFNTLAVQSFVAFAGYFLFGGMKLFRQKADHPGQVALENIRHQKIDPFTGAQKLTLTVIAGMVLGVIVFRIDVGMAAFVGAVILTIFRAADEEAAVRAMPWGVILMVSGVTILTELLGKTGGMDLFTGLLADLSGPQYVCGMIALVTGIISVYSSSSGVVLPTFLPTIPGLIAKSGGGNALMIAYSINVGAHLVDVSPLSTLGALCLANAAATEDRPALFRRLMAWGWSMSAVGALVCQLFFGFR